MKIFMLCNSDSLVLPSVYQLLHSNQLVGVGIPQKQAKRLSISLQKTGLNSANIHVLQKENLSVQLNHLITSTAADCIIALTFPWQIPTDILTKPILGCANFHFGLLPKYKGADPIFWQLNNREVLGGITIHKMTEQIDQGNILHVAEVPIIPGETYGIHCSRLAMIAAELVNQLQEIFQKEVITQEQYDLSKYFLAPSIQQLSINWQTQTADEIECLINATNPKYDGAITYIKQQEVRILEVAPADVNTADSFAAGTIVYADATYGLIVACINKQFLKINIVHTNDGYLSGIKLFNMGLKVGDCFI
jgi:methionyl-tRNA formyltransferase